MKRSIGIRSLGAVLLTFLSGPAAVSGQLFNEFPISAGSTPHGIALGSDGAMWFTEFDSNKIGRITTSGVVTEFSVPSGGPDRIAAGPDGALWFTEPLANLIGRITTAGAVSVFAVPTAGGFPPGPAGITAGPDGALWFTEPDNNRIGRITTSGIFDEFIVTAHRPNAITAGPDAALWFTTSDGIGRITTAGVASQFPVPFCGSSTAIAAGPDGALWFTEPGSNRIGRITTAGIFTEFNRLGGDSSPYDIVAGTDGAMWFTDRGNNLIGRVTIDPVITNLFPLPSPLNGPGLPRGIAAGPDHAMWFTEEGRNKIGRIVVGAPGAPPLAGCTPNDSSLCLASGRFRVNATWTQADGRTGVGQAVPLTSDSGYFWFFSPDSVEIMVKALNACRFNSRFWLFAGGLTNVRVVMTVTDMLTGAAKVYTNPQGIAFQPIQDTAAFATCP